MASKVPMTQEGYDMLMAEAGELESRRPAIKTAIEEAREKGDLRENADYHAAREELAMLNAKLGEINDKLMRAVVVDPSKAPKGKVALGSKVKIKRLKDGRELTRILVGEGEANVAQGKILTTSPVGSALIAKEKGEVVTVALPAGEVEFEILSID